MRKRHPVGLIVIAITTLVTIMLTTFSPSATAAPDASQQSYNAVSVCFGHRLSADGTRLARVSDTPEGCYASLVEAEKATGKAGIATTWLTYGQAWEFSGFWGRRIDFVVADDQAYCANGARYGWPRLANWGFNDKIRSIKAYGQCSAQMFQDDNYQPINDYYVCPRECGGLPWSWSAAASSLIMRRF